MKSQPNCGYSMSHLRSRNLSSKRMLRKCKMKGAHDNIVIIDVDSDYFPNAIIVDVPDSVEKKLRGTRVRKATLNFPSGSVISIEDNDMPDDDSNRVGDEGVRANSNAFPSRNPFSEKANNEGQPLHGKKSPVNLSKSRRTYSADAFSQESFGSNLDSGRSSSENYSSDCELSAREHWENAYLKKKANPRHGASNLKNEGSAYCNNNSLQKDVNAKYSQNVVTEDALSASGDPKSHEDNLSASMEAGPKNLGCKSREHSEFTHREGCHNPEHATSSGHNQDQHATACQEERYFTESCLFDTTPGDRCADQKQCSEDEANYEAKNEVLPQTQHCSLSKSSVKERENSVLAESYRAQQDLDKMVDDAEFRNENDHTGTNINEAQCFREPCPLSTDNEEQAIHCEKEERKNSEHCSVINDPVAKEKPVCAEPSFYSMTSDGKRPSPGRPGLILESPQEFMHNTEVQDTVCPERNVIDAGWSCIFGEREKLKETAEYKRAAEEEWASRQRQLQVQAEEAQRLRRIQKRKRAESVRLLEMERRQNLRVQEMRETQKKDEENSNLREQYRAEIRNGLNQLETNCKDLACLLRCLGIEVRGGLCPSSNEVHAAYKRALLKLHPDRATRADIREQVEAEEKFKLLSRMKEKLLPASR